MLQGGESTAPAPSYGGLRRPQPGVVLRVPRLSIHWTNGVRVTASGGGAVNRVGRRGRRWRFARAGWLKGEREGWPWSLRQPTPPL